MQFPLSFSVRINHLTMKDYLFQCHSYFSGLGYIQWMDQYQLLCHQNKEVKFWGNIDPFFNKVLDQAWVNHIRRLYLEETSIIPEISNLIETEG